MISIIFKSNPNISETMLIASGIIGSIPIIILAYQSLKIRVITIELLVSIAVIGALIIKNYEETAVVSFLFLLGGYLEKKTISKTRNAIKEIMELAPTTAWKEIDGDFEEVDIEEVDKGDILRVSTGFKVPVDGKVIKGAGFVNESSINGESKPREISIDDKVFAGTILDDGQIEMVAEEIGEDTAFGRILTLIEDAQDSKSKTEKFINKFSKYYTPLVLIIGILVYIFTKNIELAITILVLGCPGALVIGVPISNVAGIGKAAKLGILIKGSDVINDASKIDFIAFDKTGTLTEGKPKVTEIWSNSQKALDYLFSIEESQSHPIAKAILNRITQNEKFEVSNLQNIKGKGIVANINGDRVTVGNLSLLSEMKIKISEENLIKINEVLDNESTLVLVGIEDKIEAILGIRDNLKSGVKEELTRLRNMGIKDFYLLSGDNKKIVEKVAKELNISNYFGEMLPEDKSKKILELKEKGKVAFVGDGINDSPSLVYSDVGISLGDSTDVAMESADIILIKSDLSALSNTLEITKKISNNMKQNIAIALGVVFILITSLIFSDYISMSIGMLVHEISIIVVILNGLRLLK